MKRQIYTGYEGKLCEEQIMRGTNYEGKLCEGKL